MTTNAEYRSRRETSLANQLAAANKRVGKAEREKAPLAEQAECADLAMQKAQTERDKAQAACAAMHKAACMARRVISSNYQSVPAEIKCQQMAEARLHLDLICDKPNPGLPLLDELARLRRLETRVRDDELADLVRAFCPGKPTICDTIQEAIDRYRAAILEDKP